MVAGTQEYDLSTNFSDLDEQNIISVSIQGSNKVKLQYIPYNQLRVTQPDFDAEAQAVPTHYYIKGNQIGFWPSPSTTDTAYIDYYKLPTTLSSDSDVSIIPAGYREALNHYALSLEHDFDDSPDLAIKSSNRYEQIVTLARQNLLTQPNDFNNFKILGPSDFINHTDVGM